MSGSSVAVFATGASNVILIVDLSGWDEELNYLDGARFGLGAWAVCVFFGVFDCRGDLGWRGVSTIKRGT